MLWFRKKKKKDKEEKKEELDEIEPEKPQQPTDGFLRGMYCEACGYMEVHEESSELPLEGFAMCPNCGAPLKAGWFMKKDGQFHLVENASSLIRVDEQVKAVKKQTGGHHRVRKAGPALVRKKQSHHR